MNFSQDLYTLGVIDGNEMVSIKDEYLKEHDNVTEKDDYDISFNRLFIIFF